MGPLFQSRWHLLDKCPTCGFHYQSAPSTAGRFPRLVLGLATAALAVVLFRTLLRLMETVLPPDAGTEGMVLASLGLCQIMIPGIHRYARAIWEHIRSSLSR